MTVERIAGEMNIAKLFYWYVALHSVKSFGQVEKDRNCNLPSVDSMPRQVFGSNKFELNILFYEQTDRDPKVQTVQDNLWSGHKLSSREP